MIEYKVIRTTATGVPLEFDEKTNQNHQVAMARALNTMSKEEGWELVGLLGTLMFFKRPRRAKTWVDETTENWNG